MFKIDLEYFKGPLDLLLFFIKRDELDIYNIPISKITTEYLEYVVIIKTLDLETAGDFILIASTLMQIKARMLLPREVNEKGEIIDPRAELVQRLLEYKQFKEMADELSFFESSQRKVAFRGNLTADVKESPPELGTLLKNVTLYDLMLAFRKAVENLKVEQKKHEIKRIPVSIDDQIMFILQKLEDAEKTIDGFREISFISLVFEIHEKIRLIVTFIAVLELVKMQRIDIITTRIKGIIAGSAEDSRASNDSDTASFNDFVLRYIPAPYATGTESEVG